MATLPPRAVLVTRPTEYEALVATHATEGQARFFLERRGQRIEPLLDRHRRQAEVLAAATRAVPEGWRQARVGRADLDRFLFAPDDVVVVVGQDGLVANVAKYLAGQPVLGVNPLPGEIEGVLVPLAAAALPGLLPAAAAGAAPLRRRVMAEARLDDGRRLAALNEIFVGHRSHQSARYLLTVEGTEEAQSSSGLIVATGTGASGWARSLMAQAGIDLGLAPEAPRLGWFVREPWPSRATGASLRMGVLEAGGCVTMLSRMNEGGVIFADGIEADRIVFDWGRSVEIGRAAATLNLVCA